MSQRVEEIVAAIRRDLAEHEGPDPSVVGGFPALRHLEALERLTPTEDRLSADEISSHRRWIGPLIVAGKRLTRRILLTLLEPWFTRQRERERDEWIVMNEIADRCDALAAHLAELDVRMDRSEPGGRE